MPNSVAARSDQCRDTRSVGHVGFHADAPRAGRGNVAHRAIETVDVGEDHARAVVREEPRVVAAEPARCSCDDDDPAIEQPHDLSLLRAMIGYVAEDVCTADFARLQRERLYAAWEADRPGSHAPRVIITLPSYSVDRSVVEHFGARLGPLEHRYLYIILRSSQPGARVIYFSSRPVPDYVVDGYLRLVPASTRETRPPQFVAVVAG